jgi:catechol 2,3-dioxygenase-like lactoylglutathione lyase family enzyme
MRLVVEAADYDEAVRFYRDVLGGTEELRVDGEEGEEVTILDVGRATLELSNPQQVEMIDRVEVGRRVSPRLRVAFRGVRHRGRHPRARRGRRRARRTPDPDAVGLPQREAVRAGRAPDHVFEEREPD